MTLAEKYMALQDRLLALRASNASEEEIEAHLDKMDVIWNGLTDTEIEEIEALTRKRLGTR